MWTIAGKARVWAPPPRMKATIGRIMPPIAQGMALALSRRLRASSSGPRGSSTSTGGPLSPASAFRIMLVMATR